MAKFQKKEPEEGRDEKGRFTDKNLWAQAFGMYGGRPAKYETPELLLEKGCEYFEWSDWARKGKYTQAGLRLYLGFTRKNWHDYKERAGFCNAIAYLEQTLEDYMELKLGWAGSTQGAVFWLTNRAKEDWQNKQVRENADTINAKIEHSGTIKVRFGGGTVHPTQESGDNPPVD